MHKGMCANDENNSYPLFIYFILLSGDILKEEENAE